MNTVFKTSLLIGLVAMLSACNGNNDNDNDSQDQARQSAVETVTISVGPFSDYFRLTGTVDAIEDAVISSEANGRILSILDRGQHVNAGEPIARTDDRVIRAQYESAKTQYELAEDSFNRLEALYADEIISTQDYNSARAQRDQAKAQLDQAEKQLRDSSIDAPFNGRVEERFVRTGELIGQGAPVVRLVNTERVLIEAGVPERYIGDVGEGSTVLLNFRAYQGGSIESEIAFAGNVIDSSTRTFPVEIEIDNANGNLKPEMVADIRIQRRTIDDAMVIPRTAVIRDEQEVNVFVAVEKDGHKVAELRTVKTGRASGPVVQVLEGLKEGDEVVVAGMRTLSVGDRLNILSTKDSADKAEELQRRETPTAAY